MAQQLMALQGNNEPINTLGAFSEGQKSAVAAKRAKIEQAAAEMEMLGAASMYALNGDPDGEVDPAKYNEVLDYFEQSGADVSSYRDKPHFAKVAVHASVNALERLKMARDDRDFEQTLRQFQLDLDKFDWEKKTDMAGSTDTGLVPIFGRDEAGNVVVLQTTKGGKTVRSEMPEGVTVDLSVKSSEQKRGSEIGEAVGTAEVALAGADDMLDDVDKKITALRDDPDLGVMLGPVSSRMPNLTERSARVQSKMDQLQGIAFLQARQLLRGGGPLTDFEGKRAEAAYARMTAPQSEADFKAALDEFNDAVKLGVKKLKKQAALRVNQNSDSGADLYDKYDLER